MMVALPEFGHCPKCDQVKPAIAFYLNRDSITQDKHPLGYVCKECIKKQARARLLRAANSDYKIKPWFEVCW
jgi:hypothetical protein